MWHLRIHIADQEQACDVYQYLITICDVVLCVFEQHDNRPHIHMLFNERKVTQSTVIQKLKKRFPFIHGNGAYSCQDVTKLKKKKRQDEPESGDPEKAKNYLCKGASINEMPIVIGHTDVDIEKYHNDYWTRYLELKSNGNHEVNMGCQNDSSLVSKAKSKSWSERVFDDVVEKYQSQCMCITQFQLIYRPSDYEKEMYDKSRKEIFRYMMKCLGKAVKKINHKIIEELWSGFINAIIQNSGNEESANAYSDKLFDNLIK